MEHRLRQLRNLVLGANAPGQGEARVARETPVQARARARRLARQRASMLAAALGVGLCLVALRTGWIMLVPDERLEDKARSLYHDVVVLEARRGDILDRDGHILATTVSMPELHADPARIPPEEIPVLAAELAPLIGRPAAWIAMRMGREGSRDVLLAREVRPEVVRRAAVLGSGGRLFVRETSRRYTPDGHVASALLGVVGNTGSGREGLERSLDEYLRGDTFQFVRSRDRSGHGLQAAAAALQAAHEGHDVVLTIDRTLQFAAEQALDEVVERSAPLAAHIVVMDVRTGEILAMANRPATNPNDRGGIDPKGLRNYAVADTVEPGSVFKPFIVALALDDGIVTPQSMIDCEGGAWRIGRSRIRDDHAHGVVTLSEVVKYSSNIGAAKLALGMGAETALSGLRDFGFARSPGTRIPGALPGYMRSAADIKPIELATTSYGQGVTATTLQLASAVATIANDGVRMEPTILREVRDRNGQVVFSGEPQVDRRVISAEAARSVAQMMVTVTETGGTGTRAAVPGYAVAGKTGTAWKVVDGKYSASARVASFIGFLPADDPEVAIAVVTDTPTQGSRYGGTVSGPAFKMVAEAAMRHRAIEPDPELLGAADTRGDAVNGQREPKPDNGSTPWAVRPLDERQLALTWGEDGKLRLPDTAGLGLRDILVLFEDSGIEVALSGFGQAVSMHPEAGALVAPGDRVEVRFQ
jgi:cell division protein FtsI (penicillin-binding protein 3)